MEKVSGSQLATAFGFSSEQSRGYKERSQQSIRWMNDNHAEMARGPAELDKEGTIWKDGVRQFVVEHPNLFQPPHFEALLADADKRYRYAHYHLINVAKKIRRNTKSAVRG